MNAEQPVGPPGNLTWSYPASVCWGWDRDLVSPRPLALTEPLEPEEAARGWRWDLKGTLTSRLDLASLGQAQPDAG